MNSTIKRCLLLSILTALATVFSGCNTTRGFGEDLEKVGDEIQEEADK